MADEFDPRGDFSIGLLSVSETTGPRLSGFITTSGRQATGASSDHTADESERAPEYQQIPRHVVHRASLHLRRCAEDVDRAIGETDFIRRVNALASAKSRLDSLWNMRTERESEFAEFINMIRIQFAVRGEDEGFTDEELKAMHNAMLTAMDAGEFDDELNDRLTEDLIRSGLDVLPEFA